MKAAVINIDAFSPEAEKIKEVAEILRKGGIAAIPTETVFGIACRVSDKEAIDRIYDIKQRPRSKPFTTQIADVDRIYDYTDSLKPRVKDILNRFWPGPLTVIINTGKEKKGFRIPANKSALAILNEIDFALAVTSANISGRDAFHTAKEVIGYFGDSLDVIVDDGLEAGGIESTVLDCAEEPFKIVRQGAIADKLKKYILSSI